jgi:hypothetical protein
MNRRTGKGTDTVKNINLAVATAACALFSAACGTETSNVIDAQTYSDSQQALDVAVEEKLEGGFVLELRYQRGDQIELAYVDVDPDGDPANAAQAQTIIDRMPPEFSGCVRAQLLDVAQATGSLAHNAAKKIFLPGAATACR